MSSDYSYVGVEPASTGVATVDGGGPTWTTVGEFYLGSQGGNGTLTVSNGGTLSSDTPRVYRLRFRLDRRRDRRWRRIDLDQ